MVHSVGNARLFRQTRNTLCLHARIQHIRALDGHNLRTVVRSVAVCTFEEFDKLSVPATMNVTAQEGQAHP